MISRIIDESKIKALKPLLHKSQHVVITCHMSPDGDATGSSLALSQILSAMGKEAMVVVPDAPNAALMSLPGAKEIVDASRYPEFATELFNKADLIFCLDFNEPKRVDRIADILVQSKAQKVMIDHHEHPDEFCDITISYPQMSSTCYLLFRVLCRLELFNEIDKKAAECILAGMMTDTGNFSYNATDPEIYIVIAELMKKGADKDRLYTELFNTTSADCMRLNGYAVSQRMRLFPEGGAAMISLTRGELNRYHYVKGDTEGLVNRPLAIPGIVYSAFFREESDYVKVSMRSVGDFPVNKICKEYFNGGGHLNAAGGEFNGTLEEAINLFASLVEENKRLYIDNKDKE
jgi:phosphoesterase RecJ-like protein